MNAPDTVKRLVEEFARVEAGFVPTDFDERQLQQTYVEPLFEALGWNVRDPAEVIVEKRVHVRESTKFADYVLLVGGKTQLVVETKDYRKGVANADFIFQLKRYGYSIPCDFGVLTNFAHFNLYDTGLEPIHDNPGRGLVKKFALGYEDYVSRWDDLYGTFSREAVAAGALKELLPKTRRERNKEALDKKFFVRLSEWRAELATNVALRNKDLNEAEINEAVQRLLDRVIFTRVIEDRGVEATELLSDALNRWRKEKEKPLYQYLLDKFRWLRPQYNGLLFNEHPLSENAVIDDAVLRQFLDELYYPKCPYQFNVVGVELLGTIYERVLGSSIRLTPTHRAVVEEKPEVRKAGGVYYTPKYIVDYIVANTVGELLKKCKTPADVAKLKILDPACGSGSFLLGAFDVFIKWHKDYYTAHPEKIGRGLGAEAIIDKEGRLLLTARFKNQILQNNIFGVDIDPQACEVTQMSLYLKLLEDVDAQFLIKQVVLPRLDEKNIKCGNSLIGSDYFEGRLVGAQGTAALHDDDKRRRVNPMDWDVEFGAIMKAGGFDAVIGNPPYVRVDNLNPVIKEYLNTKYESPSGKYDLYYVFIEKSLALINRESGHFGFIVPNRFCVSDSGYKLRRLLTSEKGVMINSVSKLRVFEDAANYPVIIIVKRSEKRLLGIWIKITDSQISLFEEKGFNKIDISQVEGLPNTLFPVLAGPEFITLYLNLIGRNKKYAEIFTTHEGFRIPVGYEKPVGEEHIVKQYQFRRYTGIKMGSYINRSDREKSISSNTARYVNALKDKIIMMEDALRFEATLDITKSIPQGGVYYSVLRRPDCGSIQYFLGLLNSKLTTALYENMFGGMHMGGGYLRFRTNFINEIPLRLIDFEDKTDVARHDKMVGLVEEMLALQKQYHAAKSDADKTRLTREVDRVDRAIDELVYELYGLTEEEIKTIESL